MKNIFIICPTYRHQNIYNNVRYFGIVSLLKQIKQQKCNCNIKLAIIDSSELIHSFFSNYDNSSSNILYFHIPDRNNISNKILNNFKYATSFIPNDTKLNNDYKWQKIVKQNIA